ncbi:MAG TPA: 2-dehydropantoate 2-reductase [Actinomycetota bacterium]|nr:2-dehydropantoate 2-reductase [Actinomycetota bacterium]
MRIAVVGAGAVGGYFGGRLAEAGEDVTFIARGAHLEAIRERGLEVRSTEGDFTIRPASATDDPGSVGPVDAVLVAVKAWQLPEAASGMRPMVEDRTAVVPLLNGIEAPDVLREALGPAPVLGGLCRILAHRSAPGRIDHTGFSPTIEFGELDGSRSERAVTLLAAFERARGVEATLSDDIQRAMWMKLVFIAAMSAVGAATRAPIGVTRSIPETRDLLTRAFDEVRAVARARGVGLPEDLGSRLLGFVDALPEGEVTSMQRDVLAGRPSELEAQVGAVVRLGRKVGVPTPVHEILYATLLPQERRARGEDPPVAP